MTIEQSDDIAHSFRGWQCRMRQHAVRRSDGRPSAGMCATVHLDEGATFGPIVTVLVKADPREATAQFSYIVKQTHDPQLRYEAAIKCLQNVYYQYPREFSDAPTALFNLGASAVTAILKSPTCVLEFKQANQRFSIPVQVERLDRDDPFYAATYWHNAMFNPKLIGPAEVLKFVPDWQQAVAEST